MITFISFFHKRVLHLCVEAKGFDRGWSPGERAQQALCCARSPRAVCDYRVLRVTACCVRRRRDRRGSSSQAGAGAGAGAAAAAAAAVCSFVGMATAAC